MSIGYRQPPLYHIGSYPERMPKARTELSKLGGILDGLLGDMRVSADDLKTMEDSAMVLGSFSPEKLLPDHFIDPADANIPRGAFHRHFQSWRALLLQILSLLHLLLICRSLLPAAAAQLILALVLCGPR